MIMYSPAEPASVIRNLERQATARDITTVSSPLPEQMGVDFCWRMREQWWGIQRKELNDFVASLNDGRLTKEVAQMRSSITMPIVVLEGRLQVANDNVVTSGFGGQLSLSGLHKRMFTLQSREVAVLQAPESSGTVHLVLDHYEWSQRADHATATTRPKPAGDWGRATNRDFQLYLLASIPGVGPTRAERILDTLGRCPLRVDASLDELTSVDGIGEVTARRIIEAFDG